MKDNFTLKEVIEQQLQEKAPAFAEQVAPIYQLLNWKWTKNFKDYIPSEDDITNLIYKEMFPALKIPKKNSDYFISTGGICLKITRYENEMNVVLSFEIEKSIFSINDD